MVVVVVVAVVTVVVKKMSLHEEEAETGGTGRYQLYLGTSWLLQSSSCSC